MRMEEAIISNCRCHSQTQMTGDEDDATPRFVIDLLKNRITALEKRRHSWLFDRTLSYF